MPKKREDPFKRVSIQRQELTYFRQCARVVNALSRLQGTPYASNEYSKRLSTVVSLLDMVDPLEKQTI